MDNQPVFLLKIARELIDEAWNGATKKLELSKETDTGWDATDDIGRQWKNDMTHAMKLCDDAVQTDPNVELDGMTPSFIKAKALVLKGIIEVGYSNFLGAIEHFKQSLACTENQDAYYHLGICFSVLGRHQDAKNALQKCIDFDPDTELAVTAGKEMIRRCSDTKDNGTGCFITTAVYGRVDAPEVLVFKRFRDEVLFKYYIGRKLASFYSLFSPYAATLIGKSLFAKLFIKTVVLKPAIYLINYRKRWTEGLNK